MVFGLNLPRFRNALRRYNRTLRPKRFLWLEALEERFVPSIIFNNATTASVTDGGGLVLDQVHVELIFWGSGWQSGQGPTLQSQAEDAVASIVGGSYVSYLSQYRSSIQSGSLAASVNITSSDPSSTFTGVNVENMLRANISNGALPDPSTDPELLYMVIPQPGSTASFGGTHSGFTVGTTKAHYGWTEDPGDLDTITYYFSHELVESVTDPEGTAIQVNPSNVIAWNEIGDGEPQNYSYRLNGYLVQSWFSQADHGDVIPTGQSQNFYISSNRVLTVNGDQLASPDDIIAIDNSDGGYTVTLNGETVQFAAREFFRNVSPVSSIVVNTGTGNDNVNIEGTISGLLAFPVVTVNLGDGTDAVNLSPTAQILSNLAGGVIINGGSGADTLNLYDMGSGSDLNYTITDSTIARPRMGTVTYHNLANLTLTTSSGNDTIFIKGTPAGTAVAITGGGGNDTLVGSTAADTWNLTGSNSGLLSSAMIAGPVSFTAVQNLSGQGGNDTFLFSDGAGITGNLDGGSGKATLDYAAYSSSVLVDLQTGTATGVGGSIAHIDNVIGGSGGGAGIYNILVGNGGNTLSGGNGRRNLLIAGASASTLNGGDDEDILIGGTTAYDLNLSALQAIMNYWSGSSDDYATRVGTLLSGSGVPLLDPTTVTSNGGGNTLTGGPGANLYYGNTADTTDFDPTSAAVFVPV